MQNCLCLVSKEFCTAFSLSMVIDVEQAKSVGIRTMQDCSFHWLFKRICEISHFTPTADTNFSSLSG